MHNIDKSVVQEFLERQIRDWDTAKNNYEALKHVKVKEFELNGSTVKVQFNPARIVSSAAKVDAKSLKERKCFLCEANRPAVQEGLPWEDYTILVNPFPIFPKHLTIPANEHTPQLIAGRISDMMKIARVLESYVVFYNGPKCGASAPDHMHFQAGNKGFMPVEADMKKADCHVVKQTDRSRLMIAEGLAQKIAEGKVPEKLLDKKLLSLDLTGMVAGAKYRGEFEDRIKKVMQEAKKDGNIILFIDELHTIVGTGSAVGAVDAANILKPALSRGEIQVVGATTLNEYRKYIEKDAALERRFQPVTVGEPSQEATLEILKGLREKYEQHHGLHITDEALKAAVELSARYINDRFLPDKAIDLMDEAASRVQMEEEEPSEELTSLEEKLNALAADKEAAIAAQDFEKAAQLRDTERDYKKQLETERNKRRENNKEHRDVTEEDIAAVVSDWTGVPVTRLTEDESQRLLHMEDTLHKRVVGQDEAVKAVARAIRRGRVGLKDPKRPIGSFLFLGPTGVGKTELCKSLAEAMFGDENAMIRIDMSEYMERHTVSRLVGSPPGYVGHDEGGQLTEKVRRKPYSVVLFDEIEKAHEDVWNIMLQILDDGRITESQGRTVDFKNTVIVMTSNIGAKALTDAGSKLGFATGDKKAEADADKAYEQAKETVLEELRRTFRPEFLNRIDDIIVFRALTEQDIEEVARRMLRTVENRMESMGIHLDATEEAVKELAREGFDPKYGARPLRRAIQNKVEDAVAERMLDGTLNTGDTAKLVVEDDKLVVTK